MEGKKPIICICCNMVFAKNRDQINHLKTNKHIKKSLELNDCDCPVCDYKTDDKYKLREHLKDNHSYEVKTEEIKCDVCNIILSDRKAYNIHLKTNKHIKKNLQLNDCQCPFCEYKTDEKGNLNKHLKSLHSLEVEIVKDKSERHNNDKIPEKVIKIYHTLLVQELGLRSALRGLKSRYKRLLSRFYKPEEDKMIETKLNFQQKLKDYNNTLDKKKDIEDKYPTIIEIKKPSQDIDESDDVDDEDIEEQGLKAIEDIKKIKEDKRNNILKQIEENQQLYIENKGDKKYRKIIMELEEELKHI